MTFALLICLVTGAAPAHGHSDLAGSTPAQGAIMARPPTQIDLRFNEDISAEFAQVSLNRDGGPPQRLRVTVRGPLLTAQVPQVTSELP